MPSILIPNKQFFSLRFAPNNSSLVAVTACESDSRSPRGTLFLVEITPKDTLKLIRQFEHNSILHDVEWCDSSPNPSLILTASGDSNLQLWNVFAPNRAPIIFSGHSKSVLSINHSKLTNEVLSASTDCSIILWDLSRRTALQQRIGHKDVVYMAEFHPKFANIFASVSADTSLKIWDAHSPSPCFTIRTHFPKAYSCNWSPFEDNTIATSGADGFIRGWDLRQFTEPCFELGPIEVPIKRVKFSPYTYGLLASVSEDGYTRLWDRFSCSLLKQIFCNHNAFASDLDWNSVKRATEEIYLADCGLDGCVHLFNPTL